MFKEVIRTNLLTAIGVENLNEISINHIPNNQKLWRELKNKNFLSLFLLNTISPEENNSAKRIQFCHE